MHDEWGLLMTWLQRYHARHYLRNSMWILPSLSILAALGAIRLVYRIDRVMDWQSSLEPETARAVLATMAASMFTFIVFISSALLVAVQLASSQLTPRIIAIVFRDSVTRFSLAVFVFTFTFALAALVRVTTTAPTLTSAVAAYRCLASLVVFLYLIDHVGKALRPSGALRSVAVLGRAVVDKVYPRRLTDLQGSVEPSVEVPCAEPAYTVVNPSAGVVLAFDIPGLVSLAERNYCV